MIAIWIGIPTLIYAMILVFALSLCRSAALADKEFTRALMAELKTWPFMHEQIESNKEPQVPQRVDLHSSSPVYIRRS